MLSKRLDMGLVNAANHVDTFIYRVYIYNILVSGKSRIATERERTGRPNTLNVGKQERDYVDWRKNFLSICLRNFRNSVWFWILPSKMVFVLLCGKSTNSDFRIYYHISLMIRTLLTIYIYFIFGSDSNELTLTQLNNILF